jgi:hypothetical protein
MKHRHAWAEQVGGRTIKIQSCDRRYAGFYMGKICEGDSKILSQHM